MPSISQLLQILGNANFSLIGCQANNWLGASGTKTSFRVRQFANLLCANRFFGSLLPTPVIRSLLVLHITNQHYVKCDLCSVFRDLWSVRAKYGCMVLSSLNNRSCCPSEFFFQWFYRTKGLADTEITKKQKNTLSLLKRVNFDHIWLIEGSKFRLSTSIDWFPYHDKKLQYSSASRLPPNLPSHLEYFVRFPLQFTSITLCTYVEGVSVWHWSV